MREHNASRFDLIGPFQPRNNLNVVMDMVNRSHGFRQGATFWMNLVSVLNFRFDSLHMICEGVVSMLLTEMFGSAAGRLETKMRLRKHIQALEASIAAIQWPRNTKVLFTELTSGCATERLGAFLIAVPMALSRCKLSKQVVIFLCSMIVAVGSHFLRISKTFDVQDFLQKLATLQVAICGSRFSTLKFHVS